LKETRPIYILKEIIFLLYNFFFSLKFQYNFVTMSNDGFKDNSNKSKNVIKDEVGKMIC